MALIPCFCGCLLNRGNATVSRQTCKHSSIFIIYWKETRHHVNDSPGFNLFHSPLRCWFILFPKTLRHLCNNRGKKILTCLYFNELWPAEDAMWILAHPLRRVYEITTPQETYFRGVHSPVWLPRDTIYTDFSTQGGDTKLLTRCAIQKRTKNINWQD